MAGSGWAHHEEEGVGLGEQGQQVGGRVLVVQHLHLQLPRMRRRLPPHRCVPHLRHIQGAIQTTYMVTKEGTHKQAVLAAPCATL